ncbi:rRNA maturation RNase YbeY [Polynucleobacter sp. HIN7]|uniref:rRNA maturation RNase YbeY n=1 Tax=Polynucleobacter sp. HIN7 TaxID=3047866 RepID=UPI0025742F2D|nr:rRNA maturation RNase YbeY [Polynucleobacter sp. HIN7]BEI37864.1 rRNA maturation RNase YbeY [Polynucleobacter sp. HIN7]
MSQTLNLDLQFATQALQSQVLRIASLAQIRKWAGACFQSKVILTIRFVNRAEAHDLNLFFRGFDKPTNVLTFSYPTQGKSIEADIVLCLPILRKEAKEQQKPLAAHLAHLLIHGCLHAKGYDHLKPKDAKQMEALEIKILQSLGFANPY